ncbi:hypothetical protein UFOVP1040_54 [uncultured Caudovirales phage]|uniref:Uncharacterized protein n=1 Tax=uncultured Caudovirales phage TaxID=2100421 RepID=A0A6J5Q6V4_9CAUD|nr:hypothetical protein UFOVP1040_54 [uncultured Caudovirales phage]
MRVIAPAFVVSRARMWLTFGQGVAFGAGCAAAVYFVLFNIV